MQLDVRAEADILSPRAEVAAFAMEAENDPEWIGGISSARRVTDPPTVVGTRVERVARFLGRRIDYVMEVAEHQPAERIVLRSIKSPFPMRVTYEFVERARGTRAAIRVEGDPGAMYRIGGPVMAALVRRSITRDLRNLKRLMESSARPV